MRILKFDVLTKKYSIDILINIRAVANYIFIVCGCFFACNSGCRGFLTRQTYEIKDALS